MKPCNPETISMLAIAALTLGALISCIGMIYLGALLMMVR